MHRVAIDFGTTGIRTATSVDGRVVLSELTVETSISGVRETLVGFGGQAGLEITLRCTNEGARGHTPSFWLDLAERCGCRAFRVLGDSAEESVVLGIARQLATEQRCDRLAVVDVGAAHAAIAVVGVHGRRLAFESWGIQNASDAIAESTLARFQAIIESLPSAGPVNAAALPTLVGIGRAGPRFAMTLADSTTGMKLIEHPHAELLPTIGVLCANIVRTFDADLSGNPDRETLTTVFLGLMDQAYDAITWEGYDLDDAECVREVRIQTADAKHSAWIECGMNIDMNALITEFSRVCAPRAKSPDGVISQITAARVIATIEPVRPSLGSIATAV